MPMNNGWLRLYNTDMTAPTANLWTMPNLLLQKLPAPTFTATAKLRIAAKEEQQYGGVVMMGMDYEALVVNRVSNDFRIELHHCKEADKGGKEAQDVIATVSPTARDTIPHFPATYLDIYLRMRVDKGTCSFAYSLDGEHYQSCGRSFRFRQGKWIGAKMGFVSACRQRHGNRGWIDADWFRVTR